MILDDIAVSARKRVAEARRRLPLERMREAAEAPGPLCGTPGQFEAALGRPGLSFICEVKRASPSKGIIAEDFPHLQIAREYEAAGASAVSVLTEPDYFGGSGAHLREIAGAVGIPALRKDFIVDEYQLYETKVLGAAAALLICALLEPPVLAAYIGLAGDLGLSALVEAHTEAELAAALDCGARIIGANNRDLRTFAVDLSVSLRLRELTPAGVLFVAESGIQSAEDVRRLESSGVDAVLIGEALMRSADKGAYLARLRGRQ
ncbi:MAG: indole-3-glycerol phosphate synthase TrpC [Treponema sp.]|jgi:indole-3-glycerol phosphate synthase|nr:indole-3-glycerol phosphate synthase TrpC [Treponema sp.]